MLTGPVAGSTRTYIGIITDRIRRIWRDKLEYLAKLSQKDKQPLKLFLKQVLICTICTDLDGAAFSSFASQ